MKKKPNGHNEMSWPFVAQEIVSLRKKNWGVSEVFFSHQLNSTQFNQTHEKNNLLQSQLLGGPSQDL